MKKHYLLFTLFFFIASNALFAQGTYTVLILDGQYMPSNLTIDQGDTVFWQNVGNVAHTTTSGTNCIGDGTWDSGSLNPGQLFNFTFNNSGSFPYFCIPHCGMGMTGSITVSGGTVVDEVNTDAMEILFTGANPFKDVTEINLRLLKETNISVSIINLKGQIVNELYSGKMNTGENFVDINGFGLSKGVYFIRVVAKDNLVIKKLIKL